MAEAFTFADLHWFDAHWDDVRAWILGASLTTIVFTMPYIVKICENMWNYVKICEMIRKWSGWCEKMIRTCFCSEKREGWKTWKTWKTWLPHWDARGPTWLPPWQWQRSQHRRQARPGTRSHPVAPGGWWRPPWCLGCWMSDVRVPTSLTSPVRVAFQVLAQSDTVTICHDLSRMLIRF